jgi:hypothetical protein
MDASILARRRGLSVREIFNRSTVATDGERRA